MYTIALERVATIWTAFGAHTKRVRYSCDWCAGSVSNLNNDVDSVLCERRSKIEQLNQVGQRHQGQYPDVLQHCVFLNHDGALECSSAAGCDTMGPAGRDLLRHSS